MDKAKVVCVLKSGGIYTPEYVERLKKSCLENGVDSFLCLTDIPQVSEICDTIDLVSGFPGWWSKLEIFKLPLGRYVYIDLDTIINNDITEILTYPHTFTMLKDFNKKVSRPASGVMAWGDKDFSYIHDNFKESMIERYDPRRGGSLGDQAYISDTLKFKPDYLQTLFPGSVSSYKWDTYETKQQSKIICYHGRPRPHETGWKK